MSPRPATVALNGAVGTPRDSITERLSTWMADQPVFFVATAPLDAAGSVNCSPKGNRREFAVLDDHTVAYLDQTGSGVETIAHLRENGRIVVMFCAFEGPPRIVRLHGRGRVVLRDDAPPESNPPAPAGPCAAAARVGGHLQPARGDVAPAVRPVTVLAAVEVARPVEPSPTHNTCLPLPPCTPCR